MATTANPAERLEDLRLPAPPAEDRLPAMLFLAALIHGVLIIGVTFNPQMLDQYAEAISLEVTIVADPDQSIDRPDEAEYLAQASQQGGGNTANEVRPSAPLESLSPIDNLGETDGRSLLDSRPHEHSADQLLVAEKDSDRVVPDEPRDLPRPEAGTAIALEAGADTSMPLPRDDRPTMQIHDDDPRQLVTSVDTRESVVAGYLDTWKSRIEAVGAEYFPELGPLDDATGSPTLEVSIDASGQLVEVVIRKSSGSAVLDRAALDILRRASPFEPFPDDIRAEYDSMRFAYKWLFTRQLGAATAQLN